MSPAEIAARLSSVHAAALASLPPDGAWTVGRACRTTSNQLVSLRRAHPEAVEQQAFCLPPRVLRYRLTPLGLAVRAEIERMEGGDHG